MTYVLLSNVYNMKRLQIYIEEELDDALAVEAQRTGASKAALIRRYVAERLGDRGDRSNSLDWLLGRYRLGDGAGSERVDDVVYPR
jgi:hypothetical protein